MKHTSTKIAVILFLTVMAACSKNDKPSVSIPREDIIAGTYHTTKGYHGSMPPNISYDTVYGEMDIEIKKIDYEGLRFIDTADNDSFDVYYFAAFSAGRPYWFYKYIDMGGNTITYDTASGKLTVAKGWTSAGGDSHTLWIGYKIH